MERTRAELASVLHRVASAYEHHPVLDELRELVTQRAAAVEAWLRQGNPKPA